MTDSPNNPTGCAIFKAVSASLVLTRKSTTLLTYSQLLALRDELCKVSATVNGQLEVMRSGSFVRKLLDHFTAKSYFTDGGQLLLDLSDWNTTSDEEDSHENAQRRWYFTPYKRTFLSQ